MHLLNYKIVLLITLFLLHYAIFFSKETRKNFKFFSNTKTILLIVLRNCLCKCMVSQKKKRDLRRLLQNITFFWQLCCMVFFQYFLKIFIFFGTPMVRKKNPRIFFLSKSKVQKSKNVYIKCFNRNLKFY